MSHPGAQLNKSWIGAGESRVQVAMSMAQEEARIKAGSLAFYRTALPAGPVLVLGFMCLEGKEVSNCEPAVWGTVSCKSILHLVLSGLMADT